MRRQSNGFKKAGLYLVLILILAGVGFVYFSPQFEKNAPKIDVLTNGFWNLKEKIEVNVDDKSGVKSYSVYYQNQNGMKLLDNKVINSNQTNLNFAIEKFDIEPNIKKVDLIIEVIDNSKWNFLQGNKAKKKITLIIDKKSPHASVVSNSYNIKKGGSAAVVVKVEDENLSDKYITFNGKYRFELIPFQKEGYYAALIAWPVWEEEFDRVSLIAIDKAKNETNTKVPLYIKDLEIKKDNIQISKKFIDKVSKPVLQKSDYEIPSSEVEVFVKQNRELRVANVGKIKKESVANMSKDMIEKFSIKPFKRLRGSKTFAGFAEKRQYFYDGQKIDEAWHLGMDWASIKHAPIKVSNSGKVIFSDFLGIYGNTIIIDHKLGLQSLYAHTSKFNVQKGDYVKAGSKIANTGSTGAVFGDHLHFGVLIQGIEVNPLEWMDKNWIKTRVINILSEAKQVIRSSK